jgi:hypothetical protein
MWSTNTFGVKDNSRKVEVQVMGATTHRVCTNRTTQETHFKSSWGDLKPVVIQVPYHIHWNFSHSNAHNISVQEQIPWDSSSTSGWRHFNNFNRDKEVLILQVKPWDSVPSISTGLLKPVASISSTSARPTITI